MYIVSIITYEDDYKHRYDNGVYPEEIMIFNTQVAAEKYVLFNVINNIIDYENVDDCVKLLNDRYFKDTSEKISFLQLIAHIINFENEDEDEILDVANLLQEEFLKGEFIDYTLEWSISECDLLDDFDILSNVEECLQ